MIREHEDDRRLRREAFMAIDQQRTEGVGAQRPVVDRRALRAWVLMGLGVLWAVWGIGELWGVWGGGQNRGKKVGGRGLGMGLPPIENLEKSVKLPIPVYGPSLPSEADVAHRPPGEPGAPR